jgi:Regulator of ribonuclease activity B
MSSDHEFSVVGRFDPSDPDDPDGDFATLAALAAQGSDLSAPTHFIHYIAFSDEQLARAAGKALAEQLGYRVRGFAPDSDSPRWSIHAETNRIPTIENVRRMRSVMQPPPSDSAASTRVGKPQFNARMVARRLESCR